MRVTNNSAAKAAARTRITMGCNDNTYQVSYVFCAQANGVASPSATNLETLIEKGAMLKAVLFNQPATVAGLGNKPTSTIRGAVLMFNTTHNNDHYGNIVVDMRLKGHVPPSTTRSQQPKKQRQSRGAVRI